MLHLKQSMAQNGLGGAAPGAAVAHLGAPPGAGAEPYGKGKEYFQFILLNFYIRLFFVEFRGPFDSVWIIFVLFAGV